MAEEQRVPAEGSEGGSEGDPTSQTPGTQQFLTHAEGQQLIDQAFQRGQEQGRSAMQAQKDREIAEMRRQQQQDDDYYEEDLPAQAGSYQPPQAYQDPVTGQWYQYPQPQQPTPPPQQRRRRRPTREQQRLQQLEERERKRATAEQVTRRVEATLRDAGLTVADVNPGSFSSEQAFTTEVNRVKAQRDEVERTRLVQQAIAKREAEIAVLTRERLVADIQAGGMDQFMSAGPSVTPTGQDELRREYETRRKAIIDNFETSSEQRSVAVTRLEEEMAERGLE